MSTAEASPPTDDVVLVELDDRRRVALGKAGHAGHRRYLARTFPDGTVILSPAVILTEHEVRLLGRPDIVESIRADRAHPERLVRRKRPETS